MIHLLVPPQTHGGVYDFACKLQTAIGDDSVCLVHLSERNVSDWEVGQDDTLILQMSGYGFDKHATPWWLLHEIEKRRTRLKSFGVFFHEIYAFGPPWTSSFWLSPLQKIIARRLVELSDFWLTNREGSARWLEKFAPNKPHIVLPVFSNIGEPHFRLEKRLPKVIVFGSAALRESTYRTAGSKIFTWAKKSSLVIHDIGAPIADEHLDRSLRSNGVVFHGRLTADAISQIMVDARYGLLTYPVDYVAKSSVFAAYCAHGLCSMLLSNKKTSIDGLLADVNYLSEIPSFSALIDVDAVGSSAFSWYHSHNLKNHVDYIKNQLLLKY